MYIRRRYGQRALVNENVGSLVNTLALHQRSDLRLEAFARLLSEEWDVSIFLDFLNAQALCLQVGLRAAVCVLPPVVQSDRNVDLQLKRLQQMRMWFLTAACSAAAAGGLSCRRCVLGHNVLLAWQPHSIWPSLPLTFVRLLNCTTKKCSRLDPKCGAAACLLSVLLCCLCAGLHRAHLYDSFLDVTLLRVVCVLLQPAKLACIEYPREPSKDEAYAWVCLYKAVWVADAVLGMRAQVGDDEAQISSREGPRIDGPTHADIMYA